MNKEMEPLNKHKFNISNRNPLSTVQLNKPSSSTTTTTSASSDYKITKPPYFHRSQSTSKNVSPSPRYRHPTTTLNTSITTTTTPIKNERNSIFPSSSPFIEPPKRDSISHKPKQNQMLTLDDFEFGKVLGKGKLGRVYCVKHKSSGLIFALKVMSKDELIKERLEKNFKREVEIQSNLYHKNITRLYSWFHDVKNIYLVLEFSIGGELYKVLEVSKRFNDSVASYYIYQVTQALIYLHSKNIIHRDLKPENIMVAMDNTLKVSDFGWSAPCGMVGSTNKKKRLTLCGTPDYLSPEMIEHKHHDFAVDIWALGILCYEFLVGKPPFVDPSRSRTYQRIVDMDI
ncbi:Spindle assembly checkpoint kinase [Candida maltosa Xu316]|uniref:Aurora kinase n=1 Tax=Candida maltosa (strain Xu316) TaxID=1245528 RepID=M3K5U1_CANMX|nr:Spindle assembly checkpoint kinase [Candida maltosa Xu316]